MSLRKFYVEYPNSIKSSEYKFKINNDDMSSDIANKLAKFLRGEGFIVKRSRTDSNTKLMSWYNFTLTGNNINLDNFGQNVKAVESLIEKFEKALEISKNPETISKIIE